MDIIMDTPDGISFYQLCAFKSALKLEIETGLRHSRGSILKRYNNLYGTNFKRKQQAVEHAEAQIAAKLRA